MYDDLPTQLSCFSLTEDNTEGKTQKQAASECGRSKGKANHLTGGTSAFGSLTAKDLRPSIKNIPNVYDW